MVKKLFIPPETPLIMSPVAPTCLKIGRSAMTESNLECRWSSEIPKPWSAVLMSDPELGNPNSAEK
jgi:hypothetical protein